MATTEARSSSGPTPSGTPDGPTSPSRATVRASVIVLAHDRREFLRQAVESLIHQDLSRESYEVIVVKNFEDLQLDEFLDRVGARRVRCDEQFVTRKLIAGLERCESDLVFLLDDDDLFEPSKLRVALAHFEQDGTLGFYHNRFRYVDATGAPLRTSDIRPLALRAVDRTRTRYLDAESKLRQLPRLAYSFAGFNHSCAVFRRAILRDVLRYLHELEGSMDTFLFVAALMSPYSILIDRTVLTRYRVHATNVSYPSRKDPGGMPHRLPFNERERRSYSLIREMVAQSGQAALLPQIDGWLLVNQVTRVFRDVQSRRRDALRVLVGAVKLRNTYPVRENLSSWVGAVLFSLSPWLGRAVYNRQMYG